MNKMILFGVALLALFGAMIVAPILQNVDAAETKEKTVKKEIKTDSKTMPATKKTSQGTVEMTKGSSNESCEKGNKCYSPFEIKISKGGSVTWTNKDTAAHTATSGNIKNGPDGKFDTGLLQPGEKFSQKFDKAGTYEYFDIVHPWMKGKVIVS